MYRMHPGFVARNLGPDDDYDPLSSDFQKRPYQAKMIQVLEKDRDRLLLEARRKELEGDREELENANRTLEKTLLIKDEKIEKLEAMVEKLKSDVEDLKEERNENQMQELRDTNERMKRQMDRLRDRLQDQEGGAR